MAKTAVPCSGVILSGGLSSRYNGENKALLRVGGRRIMDHLYGIFSELFDEIILVTNEPRQFLEWDLHIVTDIHAVRSSLTGIHTGLFYSSNPFAFFTACDTPFLKKELVQTLLENIDENVDIVWPQTKVGIEPLCAVYSKRCLQAADSHIRGNKFKIQRAFRRFRKKEVSEEILREKDPELLSFFNVNTPEDLARAESMVQRT